ncbi:galectin-3b [Brachionichthys hirsutus]|uniref:galectin-3b n=1 Tax=Brachionichthys hirsutus TaxID=412623 RepID=UPI003604BAEF
MSNPGFWSAGGDPSPAPGSQLSSNVWPAEQGNKDFWPSDPCPPAQPLWPSVPNQPGQYAGEYGGQTPEMYPSQQQTNMSIPYEKELSGGVHDNRHITIIGTVKPNPDKITFDMCVSNKDIAFHFNPRFKEYGNRVIVVNSCIGKVWGKEERVCKPFPFQAGKQFKMEISCSNRDYTVKVDGNHVKTYRHRITNLRSINKLSISNDVTLQSVQTQN